MFVDFNILNQLGSPSINSNTFANRPAAGQTGRLFVSTDTFEIYRDNGTGWDLIGGPGAGTITGTGTATQVAYFTGAQTIGSSANLFWDNTAGALGINTATPSAELDIHGTGIIVQVNSTSATANSLLAFQRSGSGVWRIGDQYNGGSNFFELHNTVLTNNAIAVTAANNKSTFTALETYASGLATGNQFTYNLTVPNGVNITSPNAVGGVNSYLNLSLGGNTSVPVGARQGLEGNSRISFTGAGTLTMTQGSTVRAFSALSSVYSFAGSAVGTVTHLAGLRICFPDNIGSAINITNNYGLLLNDQTAGLGTVTYTNRWGIYQEGASDLNYFNGNLLVKTTTNAGFAADINGTARVQGRLTVGNASTNGEIYSNPSVSMIFGGGQSTNVFSFSQINTGVFPTDGSTEQSLVRLTIGQNTSTLINSIGSVIRMLGTVANTSATNVYNNIQTNTTINTTGGTTTYRGFYHNPTLTSLTGTTHRAIETVTGTVVFGSTSGNVLIGTTTDAGFRLDINGTLRASGAIRTDAGNTVLALNLQGTSGSIQATPSNGTSKIDLNSQSITATLSCTANNYYDFRSSTGAASLRLGTSNLNGGGIEYYASVNGAFGNHRWYFNAVEYMRLEADRLIIDGTGTLTTNTTAQLQVNSTTKGFLPPRMTTAQKNLIAAPANGLVIYDTTLAKLCVFTGVNWETVTSV